MKPSPGNEAVLHRVESVQAHHCAGQTGSGCFLDDPVKPITIRSHNLLFIADVLSGSENIEEVTSDRRFATCVMYAYYTG